MDGIVSINDRLAVARFEPDERSFERIAAEGFRSVVNLQTAEEKQKVGAQREGELARAAKLDYRHIGVSKDNMDHALVDRFRTEIAGLPAPVLVHCASGKRSGAFAMMHVAREQGWSGDETIERAEKMGFECNTPDLKAFVKSYVDRR